MTSPKSSEAVCPGLPLTLHHLNLGAEESAKSLL